MKKVLVTLFLFIVGVLPIFFASSYAADDLADDCFSVKELIANSDTKDALNRIVKPLRMHVQDFQDAGINYEGQLDIACLIGIYMTRDLGGDGDEALARFTALTEVMKGNMDNHVLSMKDLWQYKESNELTDRERREGYSDSEFFILVWADMPQKVPKSMRIDL